MFAPLAAWLAAPGHEHEMVWLWLETDPRSANPDRFDAACRAFTTALGSNLLKASDLPAGRKWGELTSDELAALLGRPRVWTDWSACTGEQLPTATPKAPAAAAPAAPVTSYDHWMADMSDVIGPRLLSRSSSRARTTPAPTTLAGRPSRTRKHRTLISLPSSMLAAATSISAPAMLSRGRQPLGTSGTWTPFSSYSVRLEDMLSDVLAFANQESHDKEIILLSILALADFPAAATKLSEICSDFLVGAGWRVLQPGVCGRTEDHRVADEASIRNNGRLTSTRRATPSLPLRSAASKPSVNRL